MLDTSREIQMALQHHRAGRLQEAQAIYQHVLRVQPNQPDALHLLGVVEYQRANYVRATELIRQAIRINDAVAEYHCNLGNALKDQGRSEESISAYRRALAINPTFPAAHFNLGLALLEQGRPDEAIACQKRALALEPGYPDAHNALGIALKNQGRVDEAIAAHRRAIALRPGFAEAHNNLGIALQAKGEFDAAVASYQKALALKADFPEAYCNLGLVNLDQGRVDDACVAFRRALTLKPNNASAHLNHALALLLQGEFAQGWKEYEWRLESARELKALKVRFRCRVWQGEDLAERKILLYSEQGLGDTLQFIRYAPRVAQRGGRVFVECQPELKRLLQSVTEIEAVIGRGEPHPDIDICCPLLSLPMVFGTTLDTIPADIPYLAAEPDLVAFWSDRLASAKGFKVGLVWGGRPTNRTDRRRSCALSDFVPFAKVAGIRLFSLQKGPAAKQVQSPPKGIDLIDWTGKIDDFADTAALVANLDLVISVDTAVAHLAGALGKPVWLLCRFDSEWRWLLNRDDSPWYPSMRIFRQRAPGNWAEVMDRVAAALNSLVRSTGAD